MVNQKIAATLLAAAYTALAAPSSGCGSGSLQPGVHTVNGREYTLTLPDNYDPNNPYRLVVGIHWWGGSMQDVETGQTVETGVWSYYGLERLSEGSTIFAAPQGNGGAWADPANDYPYILAMIQQIEEGACVETDLRFSIGFSWGGSTSNGLACRSDNPFRAIAAINPAGPFACDDGSAQVGYLGIHGTGDNPDGGRAQRDRWMANNQCAAKEEAPAPGSNAPHARTDYDCQGPPVSWILFDGGHIAAPYDGGQGDSGSQTFASPAAWEFFSQFTAGG